MSKFTILGSTYKHGGEISDEAKSRESADKRFDNMTSTILTSLNVCSEGCAIVTMNSKSGQIRKVRVSHGDNGKPCIETCR